MKWVKDLETIYLCSHDNENKNRLITELLAKANGVRDIYGMLSCSANRNTNVLKGIVLVLRSGNEKLAKIFSKESCMLESVCQRIAGILILSEDERQRTELARILLSLAWLNLRPANWSAVILLIVERCSLPDDDFFHGMRSKYHV